MRRFINRGGSLWRWTCLNGMTVAKSWRSLERRRLFAAVFPLGRVNLDSRSFKADDTRHFFDL
jgi:hypothetical protein